MEHHMSRAVLEATIPGQATAGTAQDFALGATPIGGDVTDVTIVPEAALTANATNYRTFRIINKGQSGSGTTVVASFATNVVSTNDLVAFDEKALTLSAVAGAVTVAQGDVLVVDETTAGAGVAHSGYKVIVEIVRR